MSSVDSGWVQFVRRCRHESLRHGLKAVASRIARKYSRTAVGIPGYLSVVLNEERPARLALAGAGPLRINWILPIVTAGQGGLLNIFRTIRQLEVWGHKNRIYVLGGSAESSSGTKSLIWQRYFPIQADVDAFSDDIQDSDALIATSWPTAYAARTIENTAGKFYFVQDIEYMFYAPGSFYEFARQTYLFGFKGITLGNWIADVLRREFKMECSAFGFSYDRELYHPGGARLLTPGKRRVLFYARPETERRGFELGILALSIVAKKMPDVEVVLVGFAAESVDLPFPTVRLGVLPIFELAALYRSCQVALVLSHTNVSMLPLELMACGCAVVSNEGPNVEWLLSEKVAQLAKSNPQALAQAVVELLESDEFRMQKIAAGLAFAQSSDWTKEIRIIESTLLASRRSLTATLG